MSSRRYNEGIKLAIASLGACVAGRFGFFLSNALSPFLDQALREYLGKTLESGSSALINVLSSYIYDSLKKNTARPLYAAMQEGFCRSIDSLRAESEPLPQEFVEWFDNWQTRLPETTAFEFADLKLPRSSAAPQDALFALLERIDYECRIARKGVSTGVSSRALPPALRRVIAKRLPGHLETQLASVLSKGEHAAAWISAQREFQGEIRGQLNRIEEDARDTNMRVRVIEESILDLTRGQQRLPIRFDGLIRNFMEYYLGSSHQPTPFGGRQRDFERLDSWLDNKHESPYALLCARAGVGKSALLAQWAMRLIVLATDQSIHVVYFPISIRFETNRQHVVFPSLAARMAELHGENITASDNADEYRNLFLEYVRRPPPAQTGRIVVILDGLDEAAGWNWDLPYFPRTPLSTYVYWSPHARWPAILMNSLGFVD